MIKHFSYNEKDYPFHLWTIQAFVFLYVAYRLISRDYSVYGFIDNDYFFNFGRFNVGLYPPIILKLINFHWIYYFIDYLSPNAITNLQKLLVLFSLSGFLGFLPRRCAMIIFFGYLHIIGYMQATNSEIDGGTLVFIGLLTVIISPNLYSIKNNNSFKKHNDNRWPVYIFLMLVGSFYLFAGLNKIIDIGINWPFTLDLDKFIYVIKERSVFLSSRLTHPKFIDIYKYNLFSIIAGFVTIIGELGMISILFFPRGRLFFISSMVILHTLSYYSMGINFMGSIVILLLCFDINALFRTSVVYYDQDCGFCTKSINVIKKFNYFNLVSFKPLQSIKDGDNGFSKSRLKKEIGLLEENGDVYYGSYAFEKIFEKIHLLSSSNII